ncbi:MAG: T9SS type A sorting domain-containing protein [bacterium]|nr:T9SS type A sorting domain-containing protein [bacterium]
MKYLLTFVLATLWLNVYCTHINSVDISVERISSTSFTYRVTLTSIGDTGAIPFGQGVLDFGDGATSEEFDVETVSISDEFEVHTISVEHTYAAGGQNYIISYSEENRDGDILNMENSVNTPFYIEVMISTDPFLGMNSTPILTALPIDFAAQYLKFAQNPGAYDPDGDSISYKLVTPKQNGEDEVFGYVLPNDPRFYADFSRGNSEQTDVPTFNIDKVSGSLLWDAPGEVGKYSVAYIVEEWRKIDGNWIKIGYLTRDMLINVEATDNSTPYIDIISDNCLVVNDTAKVTASDVNGDSISWNGIGELFDKTLFTEEDGINFLFSENSDLVRDDYYDLVFRVQDYPQNGLSLSDYAYQQLTIKEIAPELTITRESETVLLEWDESTSGTIEIWRKVGSYNPTNCVVDINKTTGYQLIGEVGVSTGSFTDDITEQASGAQLCYRIARKLSSGGETALSDELCIVNESQSLIITQLSSTEDAIQIAWQYENPETSEYDVYRIEEDGSMELIGTTQSSGFSDQTADLSIPYQYQIIAKTSDGTELETSAKAGNVLLQVENKTEGMITLTWGGETPWSLYNPDFTNHVVYRGDSFGQLTELEEVNVFENGLTFDEEIGKREDGETICYRILTNGTYGESSNIVLNNFSNTACFEFVYTDIIREVSNQIVYPNPFTEGIRFQSLITNANIHIYSTDGKTVQVFDDFSGIQLDLPSIQPGNYIMMVQVDGKRFIHRIVKD